MLLLGIVFLALNWLGDSLDGTLARVRNCQRPRYGFYVDHIADTFAAFFLMGGLALSGYIHPAIAFGLLIAFLMLSIEAYLATYTLGQFQLSYWKFGPTEIRLLLAAGNLALLRWPTVESSRHAIAFAGRRRRHRNRRDGADAHRLSDSAHREPSIARRRFHERRSGETLSARQEVRLLLIPQAFSARRSSPWWALLES